MREFQPGFQGHDSMRAKAERMLRMDGGDTQKYAKGGHVEHKAHGLTREQSDMHMPRRVHNERLGVEAHGQACHLKKGGHVEHPRSKRKHHLHEHEGAKHKQHALHKKELHELKQVRHQIGEEGKLKHGGKAHHRRHKMEMGGQPTPGPFYQQQQPAQAQQAMPGNPMKKGGKADHHHHVKHHKGRRKMDFGGFMGNLANAFVPGMSSMSGQPQNSALANGVRGFANSLQQNKGSGMSGGDMMRQAAMRGLGGAMGMKKGGKAHHTKHHRKHECGGGKYAGGGTVYEAEMVSDKVHQKFPHANYEKDMMGEKKHHVSFYALKRGGPAHHKKMAIGGVGKIRHEQSTKAGMPIRTRHHRVGH